MRPRAGYDCTTSAKGRESGRAAYHFVRARMGEVRPARASLGGCPHRHGLYFPKQVGASPGPWTPRGTDATPVGARMLVPRAKPRQEPRRGWSASTYKEIGMRRRHHTPATLAPLRRRKRIGPPPDGAGSTARRRSAVRLNLTGVPQGKTAGSPMIIRCVDTYSIPLGASLVRLLVESMVGTLRYQYYVYNNMSDT